MEVGIFDRVITNSLLLFLYLVLLCLQPKRMGANKLEKADEVPRLTADEVSRLLCHNPYSCGRSTSPTDRPPAHLIRLLGKETVFLPEAPAGTTTTLLSLCKCCRKLAVRRLNIYLGVRVIFDNAGMIGTPGVATANNRHHPDMFAHAMVYAYQALGVCRYEDFYICSEIAL